jgi:hypothetical protein
MNATAFFKWSLIPIGLVLLAVLTALINIWLFALLFVGIRLAWALVSPRIVPLEAQLPKPIQNGSG